MFENKNIKCTDIDQQQSNSFLQIKHKTTENNELNNTNKEIDNYLNNSNLELNTTEKPEINTNDDNDKNPIFKKQNTNCQICKTKESIYKCPRCRIKTCCLACVKEHKRIYKCTGIRDKFSKKPLKDFSDNDYVRDLNFINSTINETNRIGKKVFNLTEENPTDVVYICNSSKINSVISGSNRNLSVESASKDLNGKNENAEKVNLENKKEESKSFVKDGN